MNKQLEIESVFLNLEILDESDTDSWDEQELQNGEQCPQGHNEMIPDHFTVF